MMQAAISWSEDYEGTLARAKEGGRLVLLYLRTEGRPLCREMEEETFVRPEVVKAVAEGFLAVRVDAGKRPEVFAATFGGRGALAVCVLDGTGDVVSAAPGFVPAADLERFLSKAAAGAAGLRAAREAAAGGEAGALFALGEAYLGLDSLRRAEETFLGVIGRKGVEAKWAAFAHERLGRMRVQRGRCDQAREHVAAYRRFGTAEREDRVLLTEAIAAAVERKHAEALRQLEAAMKRFPESGELDYMMLMAGVVHHEAGEDARAQERLEGMLRRFPKSAWAAYARVKIEHITNPPPDHVH